MRKIFLMTLGLLMGLCLSAAPQGKGKPAPKAAVSEAGHAFRSVSYPDQMQSDLELTGDVDPFHVDVVATNIPEGVDAIQRQLAPQMALLGLVPVTRQEVAKAKKQHSPVNQYLLLGADELVFRPKDGAAMADLVKRISFLGDRARGEFRGEVKGFLILFKISEAAFQAGGHLGADLQVAISGVVVGGYGEGKKSVSFLMGDSTNSHDLRSMVSAVAQGETPEMAMVDANEFLKVPSNFDGALIKNSEPTKCVFAFHGEWTRSATIEGATAARYSSKAASLRSIFSDDKGRLRFGFNLGMKRGVVRFRAFNWAGDGELAKVVDEGTVVQEGDLFKLAGRQYTVVFRQGKSVWSPDKIVAGRFEGREFEFGNSLRPGKPYGRDTDYQAGQYAPEWAAGSYVHVSDGFLGKFYFRLFGGKSTVIIPTITMNGGLVLGASGYYGGRPIDEFRPVFSRGVAFYRTAVGGARSVGAIKLEINSEGIPVGLVFSGDSNGLSSRLTGASVPVEVGRAEADALLQAAKTNSGLMRALPVALDAPFKGCVFHAPWPAYYADFQGPAVNIANRETQMAYAEAVRQWQSDVQAAGGSLILVELAKWADKPTAMNGIGYVTSK